MIMGFYLPCRYSSANNIKYLMSYLQGNVFFMTKEMPLWKCKHKYTLENSVEDLFDVFDSICERMDINHGLTPKIMPDKEWLLNAI